MIAIDTSVVVAGFGAWHEHHALAREAFASNARLAAHTALETYSVLTRLPDPFRVEPRLAVEFLRRNFATGRLTLGPEEQATAPERFSSLGISGGAVYDGLIALAARAAGLEIVSLDRRAVATYERCEAQARLLA